MNTYYDRVHLMDTVRRHAMSSRHSTSSISRDPVVSMDRCTGVVGEDESYPRHVTSPASLRDTFSRQGCNRKQTMARYITTCELDILTEAKEPAVSESPGYPGTRVQYNNYGKAAV